MLLAALGLAAASHASEWVALTATPDGGIIEDVYAPDAPAVAIADGTPARRLEALLCPMANADRTGEPPPAGDGDDLDKLRREVDALQSQVRKLRRGLELQEAAGAAR